MKSRASQYLQQLSVAFGEVKIITDNDGKIELRYSGGVSKGETIEEALMPIVWSHAEMYLNQHYGGDEIIESKTLNMNDFIRFYKVGQYKHYTKIPGILIDKAREMIGYPEAVPSKEIAKLLVDNAKMIE